MCEWPDIGRSASVLLSCDSSRTLVLPALSTRGGGRGSPVSRVQVQSNRPSVTEQVRLSEELMVGEDMVPTVSGVKVMGGGGLGRITTGGVERFLRYAVNTYCILAVPDPDVQISTSVKRSQSICSV